MNSELYYNLFACLEVSNRHLHHSKCFRLFFFLKISNKRKLAACLYNKVSVYILCKANEVFMVGIDVRYLDIN